MTADLVVTVAEGALRGQAAEGVVSWKGIPYAAPPLGDLRWRAPQPAPVWEGIRDAGQYGRDCMQNPVDIDAAPLGMPVDEDGLYLNVWRPEMAQGPLPVLVWIHGGAFTNGGASPATYAGDRLARLGLLVVSFNYRLGRFGFFAHPALTAEDAGAGNLANYGILDQQAALRWIAANIAAFGGDPGRVTLIGESAGGISVHQAMAAPALRGLFHGAIIMSGGGGDWPARDGLAEAEAAGNVFARAQGIEGDDAAALAALRALPAEAVAGDLDFMHLMNRTPRDYAGPVADGRIVTDGRATLAGGDWPRIPVMLGATDADLGGPEGFMLKGGRLVADRMAAAGLPVHLYRFAYVAEALPFPGAYHASDIPFFLATEDLKYGGLTTDRDRAMAALISRQVAAFAKTGRPDGAGLPDWPAHRPGEDRLMIHRADGTAGFAPDPLAAEIAAAPGPHTPAPLDP